MKFRYGIICLVLIYFVAMSPSVMATQIVYISEPVLVQELTEFAMDELISMYPALTNEQIDNFSVDTICELPNGNGWSVTLIYKSCSSIMMDFSICRDENGNLHVFDVLNWPIEELVALFDSCISEEDALALARLYLASAIIEQSAIYPEEALAIIEKYGFAVLDPSKFIVEATFVSPMNLAGPNSPAYWSIRFSLPLCTRTECESAANPYWYRVKIDAHSGKMIEQSTVNMFSDIE